MESLSDICSRLWDLDHNRLKRGKKKDYQIKLLPKAKGDKLFSMVNREKLERMPTYSAFMELLDNYTAETSEPEEETERQYDLSRAFLNRCLDTDVMKEAHSFLSKKGLVPRSYRKAFKEKLYELWFELHPRPNGDGTERSAFEHVFVGETCRGRVIGFHNWIRLYEEERRGNISDQLVRLFFDGHDHIITADFCWNGSKKSFGSFFVGTSPEFELAIYTVCFLARQKETTKVIKGKRDACAIIIESVDGQIGTCYPKIDVPKAALIANINNLLCAVLRQTYELFTKKESKLEMFMDIIPHTNVQNIEVTTLHEVEEMQLILNFTPKFKGKWHFVKNITSDKDCVYGEGDCILHVVSIT